MGTPEHFHIRCLWCRIVVVAVVISAITTLGFSIDPVSTSIHLDLAQYGGTIYKYSSPIEHAVRIMPDETIWVAFHSQAVGGLSRRKGPRAAGWTFLHLSRTGLEISKCTWPTSTEGYLDFFPRMAGGFTIRTDTSIMSLSSNCILIARVNLPSGSMVHDSANHKIIVLATVVGPIRVLNSESLKHIASLPPPQGITNYKISVWNHLIVIRDTPDARCYWTFLPNSPSAHFSGWRSLASQDPEMVRAFGDHSVISSNWNTSSPSLFVDEINGGTTYTFPFGANIKRPDTSLFPEDSCVSPMSERAGIFLYEKRRNWLGRKVISGEEISVIDFKKGRVLLSLPVAEYDPMLNCSLSNNGRVFAILRGLSLSVFDLPR